MPSQDISSTDQPVSGLLYGKAGTSGKMTPWLGGGKMITEVSFEGTKRRMCLTGTGSRYAKRGGVISLKRRAGVAGETDIVQAESWTGGWRRWQRKN